MYQHPGVYIEHVPSGALSIEAASTSVAAFVGQVKRGTPVTDDKDATKPVFVTSATQFATLFGNVDGSGGGVRNEGANPDYFGYAVNAFFLNGGSKAYIVPVADTTNLLKPGVAATAALINAADTANGFYFTARSAGAWPNALWVALEPTVKGTTVANSEYALTIGTKNAKGKIIAIEKITGISIDTTKGNFLPSKVNNESQLVSVAYLIINAAPPTGGPKSKDLLGAPIGGLDLSTVAPGAALKLRIHGTDFTISLSGSYGDLGALAADIQAQVRTGATTDDRKGFTAAVTPDKRLLLVAGGTNANPEMIVKGGATAVKLGLDPTAYVGQKIATWPTLTATNTIQMASPAKSATFAGGEANAAAAASRIATQFAVTGFVAEAINGGDTLRFRIDDGDATSLITPPAGPFNSPSVQTLLKIDQPSAVTVKSFDTPSGLNSLFYGEAPFTGGVDYQEPQLGDYTTAFKRLEDYRDISIILLPGKFWDKTGANQIYDTAIAHAEFMQNRMVIVDPPLSAGTAKIETGTDVRDQGFTDSPYTALYYPWLSVVNPYYDKDTAANLPPNFPVPPSAFAAGLWARIDGTRGVWKAPAGLEASVRGTLGPTVLIGNGIQDNLNEWGVNCLRAIIGPTVIWGARTLATKSKPEFRYVPVRRTQSMIGESLYNALQGVVFEPNDYRLWAALRAGAGTFMDGLFRSGAFQGAKASEAFYVLCGLGSTMTQGDIDAGIVRLVVGFAPLKPAEFVVVQIKQIVGQTP